MDPLTRFKSVLHRAQSNPAPLRADLATGQWDDVRLHAVTVRAFPPPAPAGDDEEWDAVIARAKLQAPLPRAPRAARPPQRAVMRSVPPELQVTPPPVPVRQAPAPVMGQLHAQRLRTVEEVRAKLDVVVWGSNAKRPAAARPAFAVRPIAEEDMVTPPPVVPRRLPPR